MLMPARAATPPDPKIAPPATAKAAESKEKEDSSLAFPLEDFLDRLMVAESGGHLRRKNPRSTALGPFQFIESTFLVVVSRHFKAEVAGQTEQQILRRRTDLAFSRRAARAYVRELASALAGKGLPASAVNVRLAFLVGPSAAIRLLGSEPDQPLDRVLSADAIAANPFMSGATVADLVQKAAVEVGATAKSAGPDPPKGEPAVEAAPFELQSAATLVALEARPSKGGPAGAAVAVKDEPPAATAGEPPAGARCQSALASCRRWIALQERKAGPSPDGAEQ